MLDEIKTDGARMMGIALLVVVFILTFGYRSPFRAAMAMLPLTIGGFWMFGAMGWFGIKLDFFNVVIIPVVIGIGVDDGIHFYQRYLDKGFGSIGAVFRQVGSAVAMTSVTSMIGFGGLAVTNYAGLQSIGYVAITGITCALFSTLLLMPSILWFAEKHGWTWITAPKQG
jgi:predicted RND superfamily exporter protein